MFPFLRNKDGSTAIEYTLIASLIVLVIVGVLLLISGKMETMYQTIATAFSG